MCIYIYIYTLYMYMCVCVCIYIYIYICIYMYTEFNIRARACAKSSAGSRPLVREQSCPIARRQRLTRSDVFRSDGPRATISAMGVSRAHGDLDSTTCFSHLLSKVTPEPKLWRQISDFLKQRYVLALADPSGRAGCQAQDDGGGDRGRLPETLVSQPVRANHVFSVDASTRERGK